MSTALATTDVALTREQLDALRPGANVWSLASGFGGTVVQIIDSLGEDREIQVQWNLLLDRTTFSASEALTQLGLSFHAPKGGR